MSIVTTSPCGRLTTFVKRNAKLRANRCRKRCGQAVGDCSPDLLVVLQVAAVDARRSVLQSVQLFQRPGRQECSVTVQK